jgi:uncharacterized membrane protein YczE
MSTNRVALLPVRLRNLFTGLVLFGVSVGLMVRAGLGLASWDVLHQGLARQTGLPLGWTINLVGAAVLALWWPLRQRPGIGTVANLVAVGLVADATIAVVPAVQPLAVRIPLLAAAIVVNAVGTGLYVGAGLGPGPRDGLMTGLAARGHSIRLVRTLIELSVLAVGWLLGGSVGIGTVAFALLIGPLAQIAIRRLGVRAGIEPIPDHRPGRFTDALIRAGRPRGAAGRATMSP